MSVSALDSASPLNAKADKAAGYVAHGRYLTGSFRMTSAEVADATAQGRGLWSIFEAGAQNALGGASEAAIDAQSAAIAALALRQPKGSAIYCTVDFDPTAPQLSAVVEYCRAFVVAVRQDGFKGGVYGGTSVMNAVRNIADYLWQAGGWSNGEELAWCHLRQQVETVVVGGVTCDLNLVIANNYGAWNLNGLFPAKPKPVPTPPAPTPGDDVTLHDVVVHIASNGMGDTGTSIPVAKVASVTAQFGLGPKIQANIGTVGFTAQGTTALITAAGWTPGDEITVRVAEAA